MCVCVGWGGGVTPSLPDQTHACTLFPAEGGVVWESLVGYLCSALELCFDWQLEGGEKRQTDGGMRGIGPSR